MKTSVALTAFVLLFGLASAVQAAQLVSSPLPTSIGTSGACYVRNSGATAVLITEVSLFSNNGLIVSFDNCSGVSLAAGHTCVVLVNDLPDDSYAACRVTAGTVGKLRGTLEVREEFPTKRVLVSEELR